MKIKALQLLYNIEKDLTITRRYETFSTINEMASHVIGIYEDYLTDSKMDKTEDLKYDSKDLFNFLNDQIGELVCLHWDQNSDGDLWEPLPKDWVHECVYNHLRGLAQPQAQAEAMDICD